VTADFASPFSSHRSGTVRSVRVGVLASGTGTILRALAARGLPIAVVVLDRPCAAIDVAAEYGLPAELVERRTFGPEFDRVAYTHDVIDALQRHDVHLVAIAGFGTILSKPFVDAFGGRAVNTHPSLLPAFKGWHAVRDALDYGVKLTGCTVHLVTVDVDEGPILAQQAVPVLDDDTEETLHERIKQVERTLYPEVIERLAAT
jgi:phosphoribosylglycinamide formyltransferase-1